MRPSSTPFRISAFYAASFVSFGIHLPFYPLLLAERGLDAAAIAVVTTVPIVLRLATASFLGSFADRLGDRRLAIVAYSALALLGMISVGPAQGFWPLLLATAATTATWNGILPVTDALATGAVRRGEATYGRMRMWGSIAFVVTNLVAGRVATGAGERGIWVFLVVSFAVQFGFAFLLPADGAGEERRPRPRATEGMRMLLGDRRLAALLAGIAVLQAGHAMLYGFASLHWASLGFSGDEIGALWALGVIGEIALFAFSGRVLAVVSPRTLLGVAGIGGTLRWLVFPLVGGTLPSWIALQGLHAASFAAAHLGVMTVIARRIEDDRAATVQGLMISTNGLAMALATLASGRLYHAFGGDAFAFMAIPAAIGGAVLVKATVPQPHNVGSGGKTSEPS